MARTAEVTMRWLHDLQFEGGGTSGGEDGRRPAILVDGDTKAATSPVELLLLAAATCTASDVVVILQKQRVKLAGLDITVRGTRREEQPRRYTAIAFQFSVRGEGADELKVRRAIDLSIEKYCSVLASLAPDITISYDVALA
jgi:putative redox protein